MKRKSSEDDNSGPVFGIKERRLALFKPWGNDSSDWDGYWFKQPSEKGLENSLSGFLGEHEIIAQCMPKDLPVLEAGCGSGSKVMALAARGYQVEGVDFAEQTIERVRAVAPHLCMRVGNIYHLDSADASYGGYISLGVLEHNPNGPLEGLKEANRVLRSGGIACISVPFLNQERLKILNKLKNKKNIVPGDLQFYQYYYSKEEFAAFLEAAGFAVSSFHPLDVYNGLKADIAWLNLLMMKNFFHWRIHRVFRQMCLSSPGWVRQRWSHMMMFVCKKK